MTDNRHRVPVDFRPSPLAREREGCRLTERPITLRLCEIIERLERVVYVSDPDLNPLQWQIVLYEGWEAISNERIIARDRPQDIDTLAWQSMIATVSERDEALARRLHAMTAIQRVAVLERIEAYGRAEAMR
ncbi:MAG TPA: hypothetical protein VFX37_15250 [Pseudolabrys sp.]|nr:hypothetical protein [Pseudolabrys sp.]